MVGLTSAGGNVCQTTLKISAQQYQRKNRVLAQHPGKREFFAKQMRIAFDRGLDLIEGKVSEDYTALSKELEEKRADVERAQALYLEHQAAFQKIESQLMILEEQRLKKKNEIETLETIEVMKWQPKIKELLRLHERNKFSVQSSQEYTEFEKLKSELQKAGVIDVSGSSIEIRKKYLEAVA